jgi:hypothetical protein
MIVVVHQNVSKNIHIKSLRHLTKAFEKRPSIRIYKKDVLLVVSS